MVLGSVAKTTKTTLNHKKNNQNHYKPFNTTTNHFWFCVSPATIFQNWYESVWEAHGDGTHPFGVGVGLSILIWGYLLALRRVGGPGPRGLVPRGVGTWGGQGGLELHRQRAQNCKTITNHSEPHRTTTNHSAYRKGVDIAILLPAGFLS